MAIGILMGLLVSRFAEGSPAIMQYGSAKGDQYSKRAVIAINKGNYSKAIEYLQKAVNIHIWNNGPHNPGVALTYDMICGLYNKTKQFDKAIKYCQKALKIKLMKVGPEHAATAVTYEALAVVYRNNNQLGKAIENLRKALKVKQKKFGDSHHSVITLYDALSNLHSKKSQQDKAFAIVQRYFSFSTQDSLLHGIWYSNWSYKTQNPSKKSENYMLDYLNPDKTYRSKVLEVYDKNYLYEENEGYWEYNNGKLTITIIRTNGKKVLPRSLPSTIRFQGKNKMIFKLDTKDSSHEVTMIRTTKTKILPIPKNKKRIPPSTLK